MEDHFPIFINQCSYLYLKTWSITLSSLLWILSIHGIINLCSDVWKAALPAVLPTHIWKCSSIMSGFQDGEIRLRFFWIFEDFEWFLYLLIENLFVTVLGNKQQYNNSSKTYYCLLLFPLCIFWLHSPATLSLMSGVSFENASFLKTDQ